MGALWGPSVTQTDFESDRFPFEPSAHLPGNSIASSLCGDFALSKLTQIAPFDFIFESNQFRNALGKIELLPSCRLG